MKKSRLLIISMILLSFNIKMLGQEDTVTIENSTEPIKESDFKQKRKYKYLDNNYREEKTLIKLGLQPIALSGEELYFEIFKVNLSLEKKINPAFSVNNVLGYGTDIFHADQPAYFHYDLGARYYYSINNRIKTSKCVNNFHNNYFTLAIDDVVKYSNPETPNMPREWMFEPYFDISWGGQRRLGKFGYIDIGPFVKFNKNNFGFGLNIMIGLGLGFNSNAVSGQNDTSNKPETNQINADIKQKQQYLDENLREEKNLFKLFAYPVIVTTENEKYGGFGSMLAYERKLSPSFSLMYSSQASIGYIDGKSFYNISGNIDFRYYYSMKKRIRQQISANNFHGNYFAIVLDDFYYSVKGLGKSMDGPWTEYYYSSFLKPKIQFMWGIQRRISNWAYYDLAPYISYDPFQSHFSYGFKLQLGLAWGK